jgi:hypothetical protein
MLPNSGRDQHVTAPSLDLPSPTRDLGVSSRQGLLMRNRTLCLGLLLAFGGCANDSMNSPDAATLDAAPPDAPPAPVWTEAFPAADFGWLLNVWGPAPDDLYAVGGLPDQGGVMHFDGQTWSQLDLGVTVPVLHWAHGFDADDVTIVGRGGTVIHWNGTAWTIQDTPTDQDLWGVWGASPDDLWAVGGAGRQAGQETILHYDGTAWTEYPAPNIERANVFAFFKVWGTNADNVYIVGQRGVVLHWDGSTWTEEFAGVSDDLISLWGTGPDRIVAVGGRGAGVASVWNGTAWQPLDLTPLPGLNGIWMDGDGIAHAVGSMGITVKIDSATLAYESELVPISISAQMDFHAVFSADGQRLVAVGGNLLSVQPPYLGVAYEAIPSKE